MRVEVINGAERRRRWSIAEKRQLLAKTAEPGATVSDVARQHGIHPNQPFIWRCQMRGGLLGDAPDAGAWSNSARCLQLTSLDAQAARTFGSADQRCIHQLEDGAFAEGNGRSPGPPALLAEQTLERGMGRSGGVLKMIAVEAQQVSCTPCRLSAHRLLRLATSYRTSSGPIQRCCTYTTDCGGFARCNKNTNKSPVLYW